jgi:hypothetical protein
MTRAERLLYHQVHPLKLLVDITTSFASSWLLWEHRWFLAAPVALLPSMAVSAVLVTHADLDRFAEAPIGRWVARHMTPAATAVRIAGQLVMWVGAAAHAAWLLPTGFAIVVFGWVRGAWSPALER